MYTVVVMLLVLDEFLLSVLVCAFSILISDDVFGFILAGCSLKSFPCGCFSILIGDFIFLLIGCSL